ncbi:hypothetical protein LCGC14_2505860 [marine sediment metagenome]|uniref:Sec-independent protein translocase protein TatA n=1 Tax=marine sediment metagenome TaxID=412755 RepID=A0A0F9BNK7_9ZZZZ
MFGLGATELLIIFAIILVLFGASRIPQIASALGKSIKEFKKSTEEDEDSTVVKGTNSKKKTGKKNSKAKSKA